MTTRNKSAINEGFSICFIVSGVEKFLKHLHDENVPFALATSSSKEMMEIKSKNHQELFNLFHHKVMGSSDPEVKQGKPSPDIFLVAARRFPDNPDPAKVNKFFILVILHKCCITFHFF